MFKYMQVGSVFAVLKAKVDDFEKGMASATRSLDRFGSQGRRLEDQLASLNRQKALVIQRMRTLEQAGQTNTGMYANLQARLANYNDRLSTHNVRMNEFIAKQNQATNASGGLQGALNNLGSVGSNALGMLATGAKVAGVGLSALGGILATTATLGVKTADTYQQNFLALQTMLGGQKEAGALMKELIAYNKQTPFELGDLVGQAKLLKAMGIETEKLVPTIKVLGDISSGVGKERLPLIALALGQVRTAGRLTGAELRQFTENGIPLLEELSKVIGKSATQIKKDMEKGVAPTFEQVEIALQNLTKEGGRFNGMAKTLSSTFTGRMSNVKDVWDSVLRGMVGISEETGQVIEGSLFDRVTKGAMALAEWLEKNKDTIISWGQTAFDIFGKATDIVKGLGKLLFTGEFDGALFHGIMAEDSPLAHGLFVINKYATQAGDIVEGLRELFFEGTFDGKIFGGMLEEDSPLVDGLLRLKLWLDDTSLYFEKIADNIKGLSDLFNTGIFNPENFSGDFKEDSPFVKMVLIAREEVQKLEERFNHIKNYIVNEIIPVIVDNWNNVLLPALQRLWDWINANIIPAVMDFLGSLNKLKDAMWELYLVLEPYIVPVFDFLVKIVGGILIGAIGLLVGALYGVIKVADWLTQGITWLITKFTEFVTWVEGGVKKIQDGWSLLTAFLGMSWEEKLAFISQKLGELVGWALQKWEEIKTNIRNKINEIVIFFEDLPKKFVEEVEKTKTAWDNGVKSIIEKAENLKNEVINKIRNIDLKTEGANAIQGFIDGIKDKTQALIDSVKNIVNIVKDNFAKGLEINSPSRVFEYFGQMSGDGYNQGFANAIDTAMVDKVVSSNVQTNNTANNQFSFGNIMVNDNSGNATNVAGQIYQEIRTMLSRENQITYQTGF